MDRLKGKVAFITVPVDSGWSAGIANAALEGN
jgi:hypothetical protein